MDKTVTVYVNSVPEEKPILYYISGIGDNCTNILQNDHIIKYKNYFSEINFVCDKNYKIFNVSNYLSFLSKKFMFKSPGVENVFINNSNDLNKEKNSERFEKLYDRIKSDILNNNEVLLLGVSYGGYIAGKIIQKLEQDYINMNYLSCATIGSVHTPRFFNKYRVPYVNYTLDGDVVSILPNRWTKHIYLKYTGNYNEFKNHKISKYLKIVTDKNGVDIFKLNFRGKMSISFKYAIHRFSFIFLSDMIIKNYLNQTNEYIYAKTKNPDTFLSKEKLYLDTDIKIFDDIMEEYM